MLRMIFVFTLTFTLFMAKSTAASSPPYADTPWPATHADSSNSASVNFPLPTKLEIAWEILKDRAIVQAATIGPNGLMYATSGQGRGHSHLTAFDRSGRIIWQAPEYKTSDDLDSFAILSAPVIDDQGDIYLCDSNQIWAFHGDGAVKWSAPLPADSKSCLSVQFIDSALIAVTGDGIIIAHRRNDGTHAAQPLQLPVQSSYRGNTFDRLPNRVMPGYWGTDPEIIQEVVAVFLGLRWPITNTPAVHPQRPRIYISAPDMDGTSSIFAVDLDLEQGEFSIAFRSDLKRQGSASSPTVSPDGSRVYVADGSNAMAAIDAVDGRILWNVDTPNVIPIVSSPSVGADGTIYVTAGGVIAMRSDGMILWRRSFADASPSQADSVVTAGPNALYVVVLEGGLAYYNLRQPQAKFYVLNPETGENLSDPVALSHSSEAYITVDNQGWAYITHLGWGTNEPGGGGVTALKPVTD